MKTWSDWSDIVRDVLAFGGLMMIGTGLWLFSPAIALVVMGVVCVLLAISPMLRRGKEPSK